MTPKLDQDAIARLPIEAGRAELLEEIISTVAPERQRAEPTTPTRSRRGLLIPLAAAAVVAGLAVSTVVYADWRDTSPGGFAGGPATATGSESGDRLLLDAPGWRLDSPGSDGDVYRKGSAFLEVTRYPASSYADYLEDRAHVSDPPSPGAPIEVLGRSARMWAYSADDHTAIREVVDGQWMELRGQGMDEAAYLALLGQLRMVSHHQFDAALPDRFVTDSERADTVEEMLQGIEAASGAGLPSGSIVPPTSEQQDPYQLGAAVVGYYACAWLEAFDDATAHDQQGQADEAARVLGTARQWPVLHDMDRTGDYPEVVWDYAAQVAAGQVPEGYREGLGCP